MNIVKIMLTITLSMYSLYSDKIDGELINKINNSNDTDYLKVYIKVCDSDTTIFNSDDNIKDKKERRDKYIEKIKRYSENSQYEIKKYINTQKELYPSIKFETLWLNNAITAVLPVKIIKYILKRSDIECILLDKPIKMNYNSTNPWHISDLKVNNVWDIGPTGKDVKVAILDSGLPGHSDLSDRIYSSVNLIENESIHDSRGHATMVAGIIAGTGASGKNTGVAPGAKLICIKVTQFTGYASPGTILNGIQRAITEGAQVINISLGAKKNDQDYLKVDSQIHNSIKSAINAGVIVVCCAGNSGYDPDSIEYPARYQEVITVGCGTRESSSLPYGGVWPSSSRGPVGSYIKPDIVAPGANVWTTTLGNSYDEKSGTSLSAPYISGIVALMLERNPNLSHNRVKEILEITANDIQTDYFPAGKDNASGSGRVNPIKIFTPIRVFNIQPDKYANDQNITFKFNLQYATYISLIVYKDGTEIKKIINNVKYNAGEHEIICKRSAGTV